MQLAFRSHVKPQILFGLPHEMWEIFLEVAGDKMTKAHAVHKVMGSISDR